MITEYDSNIDRWIIRTGDLAYWVTDDRALVRCRVELVTHERVYLRATANDIPRIEGEVWYESRFSRRVIARAGVYWRKGKPSFNPHSFLVLPDQEKQREK